MRRALSALAILVASAGLLACGPAPVSLGEGARSYTPADYDDVLHRWTRTGRILAITELEEVLTATATFKSWDFRAAYTKRYARDYRLTQEAEREMLESSLAETRRYHEFYVALYGGHRRWVDLTKADPLWVVRLVDDRGNETAPEAIVSIPKPGPIEQAYFPYTSVWRQAFLVRFPVETEKGPTIASDASKLSLRLSGAKGEKMLTWEIAR